MNLFAALHLFAHLYFVRKEAFGLGGMSKGMNKYIWIFLFLAVLIVCSLFPYTADDFTFGTEKGMELWKSGFRNYSGRYVGHTMVLLLTRYKLLRIMVMAAFFVGLDYMIVRISGCGQYASLLVIALMFAVPGSVFAESIAWTSGFCIYTTSITFFVLYLFLITCVFSDQNLSKRKRAVVSILFLVLGYLSAMIVEHVTIMQIVLGMGMAFWAWRKNANAKILYFFYPLGSVLGAITMFSNGCYAAAVAGTDFYRSVPTNIKALYERLCEQYFGLIGKQMILDNIVLMLFTALIVTILYFQKMEKWEKWGKGLRASVILLDFSVMYGLLTRINVSWSNVWRKSEGLGRHADGMVNAIFWLALFGFTVFICVEERKKARMIVALMGIACASACLVFVAPLSSRCLFAGYVLQIWYCMECLSLITWKQGLNRIIFGLSFLSAGLVLCMVFTIYNSLYREDKQRLEKVRQAVRENQEEVVITRFKYGDYLVGYSWDNWDTRYKQFYDIPLEIKIRYE